MLQSLPYLFDNVKIPDLSEMKNIWVGLLQKYGKTEMICQTISSSCKFELELKIKLDSENLFSIIPNKKTDKLVQSSRKKTREMALENKTNLRLVFSTHCSLAIP